MGNKPFKRVIAIIISMAMLIACVQVNVFAATVEPHVVINQAYGGGGNSGALYKNDFIELFNPTDSPVDMSGWTVQYASAKGAFGEFITKIPDKTEIKARGFYLIQEAAGDGGTVDLPGPDCTGDIKMGASAFKIALVSNGDAATGLKDPDVVDFLGAGTASAYEGNNAAPAPNAATAVVRKTTGVDTNDNGVDFKTATPEPRDSDSPIVPAAPETKCATPTANPASGNIEAGTKIVFATATAGAEIQYSTTASDGPWTDETDVVVNAAVTYYVRATKDGLEPSDVATFTYTLNDPNVSEAPTASPATGSTLTLPNANVVLTAPGGGDIYYTIDRSEPNSSSTNGRSPQTVTFTSAGTITIKSYAVDGAKLASAVAEFVYEVEEEPGLAIVPISTVRAASTSTDYYKVKGVATYRYADATILIQDGTGTNDGIAVYKNGANLSSYVGKEIEVKGKLTSYNGLPEIVPDNPDNDVTVVDVNPTMFPVLTVTARELAAGLYKCMAVKIENVMLAAKPTRTDGDQNFTVSSDSVNLIVRTPVSAFDGYEVGDYLTVEGFVYEYNGVQIVGPKITEGIVPPSDSYVTDGRGNVAEWNVGSLIAGTKSIPATGGEAANIAGSSLQVLKDKEVGELSYSSSGVASSGNWHSAISEARWIASFSSSGFANLSLSWKMRSSGTGPRDFTIEYSVDGGNTWKFVSAIQVASAKNLSDPVSLFKAELPSGASNAATLLLRWRRSSDLAAGTGTVQSGGTNTVNEIVITGDYILEDGQLRQPVSDTESGPATIGKQIVFSPADEDAAVEGYKVYVSTDSGKTYTLADGNTYTIATLPVKLYAKASADGKTESREIVLEFTQSQAEAPVANPSAGSYQTMPDVELKASEPGATIWYTTDGSDPTTTKGTEYKGAITGLTFPATIKAYTKAAGYSDSWVATFEYSLFNKDAYAPYFGQLHSHTTYSDGSGSLTDGLNYLEKIPEADNVDFASFTDHSNYFDTSAAANPASALNNVDGMTAESKAKWLTYTGDMRAYNVAAGSSRMALPGFEMTWSGGPGHINTFNSKGLVSRNNSSLNNKNGDAGMKLYYDTIVQDSDELANLSQFNHPGVTFGTFSDFAYWNPLYDTKMIAVEVGNGEGGIGSGGYFPSYGEYIKALDKGWHVAPTNNQDNHKGLWGNANTARTVVYAEGTEELDILKGMKAMRVYATEDQNLEISYFLNDQMMGSIIGTAPETLKFSISVNDPDAGDNISKIEVVTNGGRVASSKTVSSNSDVWDFELPVTQGYFFVRVTQADLNMAVTAPVWVGSAPKVGINSFNSSAAMPVTGEPLTLAVQVFNSEIASATVKSIEYSINGTVLKTDTPDTAVTAEEMKLFKFDYTPTTPGLTTAEVKVTILLGGEETDFSAKLDLDVRDSAKLVYVGIDSSHYNEYVDGNYKASMGNFAILAAEYDVRVVELKTSEDLIEATQNPRYKMMVLTPPTRRNGTVILDGYKNYSDAELEAITKFSEAGNVVILSGWGDYYESYATFPAGDHMAAQQNKVLESLGSTLRISDDELKDDVSNGGQAQRLYLTEYNMDNQFLEGVLPAEQVYSNYAGATIYAADASGPVAELPGSVSAMVYSFSTSYSADDDNDGFAGVTIPKYDKKYLVAASETIPRGDGVESIVIASGAVFMSNFEIQASELDNYQTPAYSNYTILANVLKFLSPTVITPIADVHKGNPGERFTIRGIATSNASGFDQDTAFFDCIYLQDDTAGINAFPVSASIQKGQTVELTGTVSAYNGEIQLNVTKITIIDEAVKDLPEPITVTTAEAKSGANLGSLVKVTGTVKSFTAPNDVVASIYVDDGSGEECLIFIDGYITESKVIANLVPGASITAIGLSSISTEGPRIRVRDRADITCTVTNISSVPALEPIKSVANGTAKEAVALGLPETVEIVTTGGTATAKVVWDLASSTYDPDSKLAQEFTVAGLIELPEGVLNQDGVSLAVSITVEVLAASEEEPGEPGEEEPGEPGEPGEEEPGEPGEEEPTPTPAAPPSGGGGWDYYVPSWPQPTPSKAPTPVPTKAPSVVTDGGTSVPKVFVDAKPADWFYQDVEYIASRGLMVGTSATEFSPNNTLSRGMIVTILGRLYEVDTARFTQTSFKDVNLGIYYAPYVEWAKDNGIAVGVADGVFQPEGFITRQDLATIIYRYILAAGLKLPEKNAYIKFTDDANISDYARTAIEAACKYGIIYGRTDGTFDPRGTATRAEAAAIVHRLIVAAGLE